MPNINIFITAQGVHKSIDPVLSGNNIAIPKSTMYQNIAVPRWQSVVGITTEQILKELFYNDYNDQFRYNLGFFKESANTGNFSALLNILPVGTKIWFVKNTVEDYRAVFQEWITLMCLRGQEKSLRRKFRTPNTFESIDIDVEYEERTVELDDFADLFNASDWMPFDTNVYLETGAAESGELQARLFVKEEEFDIKLGKKKRKNRKEKNTDLSEIDQDDDYINEDDL